MGSRLRTEYPSSKEFLGESFQVPYLGFKQLHPIHTGSDGHAVNALAACLEVPGVSSGAVPFPWNWDTGGHQLELRSYIFR